MHDVNPLGPIMHLRELDRQAAPRLRPLLTERDGMPMLKTFRNTLSLVLRRFDCVAYLGEHNAKAVSPPGNWTVPGGTPR